MDYLCENYVIDLDEVSYLIKEDSRDVDKFWCDIFKKMEYLVFGESCVFVLLNNWFCLNLLYGFCIDDLIYV